MLLPRIRSLEGASPVTAEGASHVLDDGSVCDVFFDNQRRASTTQIVGSTERETCVEGGVSQFGDLPGTLEPPRNSTKQCV